MPDRTPRWRHIQLMLQASHPGLRLLLLLQAGNPHQSRETNGISTEKLRTGPQLWVSCSSQQKGWEAMQVSPGITINRALSLSPAVTLRDISAPSCSGSHEERLSASLDDALSSVLRGRPSFTSNLSLQGRLTPDSEPGLGSRTSAGAAGRVESSSNGRNKYHLSALQSCGLLMSGWSRWEDVLRVFLLRLRLFPIHAVRLSPRLRTPALPSLPADKIARGGRWRFIHTNSRPLCRLPHVYPPGWRSTRASVSSGTRGQLVLFLVWPDMDSYLLWFCIKDVVRKYFPPPTPQPILPSQHSSRVFLHFSAFLLLCEAGDCSEDAFAPIEGQDCPRTLSQGCK